MEQKTERTANYLILRLPVIRHARAIYELLVMFFYRNSFGDGVYVAPHPKEIEMIYHIWAGIEKKRRFYIGSLTYKT